MCISIADQMLSLQLIRGLEIESIHKQILENSAPNKSDEVITFATASKIALPH